MGSSDRGQAMTGGGLLKGHEIIRSVLEREGPQNLHFLTQRLDAPRRRVQAIMAHLADGDEVHPVPFGKKVMYLLKTPEIRACDCDGACLVQAVVLHDPRCRGLHKLIPDDDCINTQAIVEAARRELNWAERTTYKWLNHLLDAGLVASVEAIGRDQRNRWYRRIEPHPTAQSVLANGKNRAVKSRLK